MKVPTSAEVDAEAVRLGIAVGGKCPPRAQAQIAQSLVQRGQEITAGDVEDLHVTVARLDRNLIAEGCDNAQVRAAAIGAFVTAILTPTNIDIDK